MGCLGFVVSGGGFQYEFGFVVGCLDLVANGVGF